MELLGLVFLLGLLGGALAGWLGIGGGVVMTPLLLYAPPLLGVGSFTMREVAGLTMAHGFFASLSGVTAHHRRGVVSRRLVCYMGSSAMAGSAFGAIASAQASQGLLKAVFAAMAAGAAVLMLLPPGAEDDLRDPEATPFHRGFSVLIPFVLSVPLGMVGQAGAFMFIPVMLHGLKIPTRIALGSSLGIVLLSAAAGLAGKLASGQLAMLPAAALVPGTLVGAYVGGHLSARTATRTLRLVLAGVIAAVAARLAYEVLTGP